MGLFTKKPLSQSADHSLYTVSNQETLLFVGLGNPGAEYEGTRHNIGFASLEHFVSSHEEMGKWHDKPALKCQLTSGVFGSTRVLAIKPSTFMNLSGQAVQAVKKFYKLQSSQIYLVHDELDITFGLIRTRVGGSSAGHNGIQSIIDHTNSDTNRIRIGIKNPLLEKTDSTQFVLRRFADVEKKYLPALYKEIDSILVECIYSHKLPPDTRQFIV